MKEWVGKGGKYIEDCSVSTPCTSEMTSYAMCRMRTRLSQSNSWRSYPTSLLASADEQCAHGWNLQADEAGSVHPDRMTLQAEHLE